jgi:hypothetical protein
MAKLYRIGAPQEFYGTALAILKVAGGMCVLSRRASGVAKSSIQALLSGAGRIEVEGFLRDIVSVYLLGEELLLALESMTPAGGRKPRSPKDDQVARAKYRTLIRAERKRP